MIFHHGCRLIAEKNDCCCCSRHTNTDEESNSKNTTRVGDGVRGAFAVVQFGGDNLVGVRGFVCIYKVVQVNKTASTRSILIVEAEVRHDLVGYSNRTGSERKQKDRQPTALFCYYRSDFGFPIRISKSYRIFFPRLSLQIRILDRTWH